MEIIARCGYAAAEVWMEHLWRTDEKAKRAGKRGRELGLELSLHAPFYDLNISSINPGIRESSRQQMLQSIELAGQLGARMIVLHPGRMSSGKDYRRDSWARFEEAMAAIAEKAVEEGTTVGVENMRKRRRELFVRPADLRRFFSQSWSRVGLTFDLAHAATVTSPSRYIAELEGDWIVHAHLSDNSPKKVHLPLGEGDLDIKAVLRTLQQKYDGLVIIEGYVPGRCEEIAIHNIEFLRGLGLDVN
jgi:sugar phosphate isomerase/epimerase